MSDSGIFEYPETNEELTAQQVRELREAPSHQDDDDLQVEVLGSFVPGQWTARKVRYFLLSDPSDGAVLGALWAGEQDDTAGFTRTPDGDERSEDAKVLWTQRIAQAQMAVDWDARAFFQYWLDAPTGSYMLTPQPDTRDGSDSLISVLS